MESGTPPKAPSSKQVHNTEASSQKDPGQGGEEKTVKAAPGGQTSGAGHMGEKIPMGADGGGHLEFGSQPDAIPETNTAPESSRQPLLAGGRACSTGNLCPTRGVGCFVGGAEERLHRR